MFRRYIIVTKIDKNAFQKYELTSEITDIAQTITLTENAKDTFYRVEPRFADAPDFIKFCKTVARGVEALACHTTKPYGGPFSGRTIILLQINDPRFIDHKYAAAAHELLHVIYGQLNSEEKNRLNNLLNQELDNHKADTHLNVIIEELKRIGKGQEDIVDELHSKFGVEYNDISPDLEEYYGQYFTNRQKVVELYIKGGFAGRVRRIDQLNQELKVLDNQLTAFKNSGDLEKYNGLIGDYNTKVSEINKTYQEVQEFYTLFNPDYTPPKEKNQ